jgi:putative tryptophan/tyrosine transport system substrate-binding protein
MRRRKFITLLGSATTLPLAWPLRARAQQPGRVRRVGIIMPYAKGDTENQAVIRAFKEELEKLGWTEGHTVQFDEHWTTDDMGLVRDHAANLMAAKPDVVVATGGRVIPILMQLSNSIPIVLPGGSDPVRVGYAKTLAHPGGNVTGFTLFELSIMGKSLEILKQIAPAVARVALIYNPDNPNSIIYRQSSEAASGPLGIEPFDVPIHRFADIDHAVTSLADGQNGGVFFLPDVTTLGLRDEIVDLIARQRLPAIYWDSSFVRIGGLAFYGVDRTDIFRRSAGYVDRILRGEKPGDLPFQQPTKYQLIINLKTAKALGLDVPFQLQQRADEVIE